MWLLPYDCNKNEQLIYMRRRWTWIYFRMIIDLNISFGFDDLKQKKEKTILRRCNLYLRSKFLGNDVSNTNNNFIYKQYWNIIIEFINNGAKNPIIDTIRVLLKNLYKIYLIRCCLWRLLTCTGLTNAHRFSNNIL